MHRGRSASALVLATAGILAIGAVPAGAAQRARPARCQGKVATIVVTGANRHVVGTPRADVILALGPGDVITGGAGNDTICAGAARSIDGGDGNDHITFTGSPVVHGGRGNDVITALASGHPTVYGDAGDDTITLANGNGRAFGGDGNDVLTDGTAGLQSLDGGAGNDVLKSRGATATLIGGLGSDIFVVPAALARRTAVRSKPGDLVNGVRIPLPSDPPVITPQPATQAAVPMPVVSPLGPSAPPAIGPSVSLTVENQSGNPALVANTLAAQGTATFILGLTTGSSRVVSWSLSFGDGSPSWSGPGSPPADIEHRYFIDGRFTALLSVTDAAGLSASASLGVDVANNPTVTEAGTASPATATGGAAKVTENITATPVADAVLTTYDVSWDDDSPDDAGTYTGPLTLTHTLAVGNHRVCWIVYDDHQDESGNCRQITVVDGAAHVLPLIQISDDSGATRLQGVGPTPTSAETDDSVIFSFDRSVPATGTTISSYSINWGDGSSVGSAQPGGTSRHTYTSAGDYTITTTMTDSDGGTAVTRQPMNIIAAGLKATVSVTPTEVAGSTISVDTTGTTAAPGVTVADWFLNWSDGLVQQGFGNPPTTITRPAVSGVLEANFYVDDDRYDEDEDTLVTTVTSTAPTANPALRDNMWTPATMSTSPFHPSPGAVEFGAPSVAPSTGHTLVSATANFGDGSPSQTVSGPFNYGNVGVAEHDYASPGIYAASLAISDDGPTTSTTGLTVDVAGAPTLTLTPSDATPADGETVTLTASAAPGSGAVADYFSGGFTSSDADSTAWEGAGAPSSPISFTVHGESGTKLSYGLETYDNHGGVASVYGVLTIR